MTPTKDQQAQEYAEKKNNERLSAYPEAMRPDLHPEYDINDIAQAYLDGYAACEQSMWRRAISIKISELRKRGGHRSGSGWNRSGSQKKSTNKIKTIWRIY